MITHRLALWIWLCIAVTADADSPPLTNPPAAISMVASTNVAMSTNIVTLTNFVKLAKTATQIPPTSQTNSATIAVATISACIALVALFIAMQQFFLAREKFKLDLFDKRFAVYKGVQQFIFKVAMNRTASIEDFKKLNLDTESAAFIFGEDITIFLEDVRSKARKIKYVTELMATHDTKSEEHHKLFKQKEPLAMEFWDMDKLLVPKFAPYLKFYKGGKLHRDLNLES